MIHQKLGLIDYQDVESKIITFFRVGESIEEPVLLTGEVNDIYVSGLGSYVPTTSVPVVCSMRGGGTTFQGRGQVFFAVVLQLSPSVSSLDIMGMLEDSCIRCFPISTHKDPFMRGVFVDGKKLCSIAGMIKYKKAFFGITVNVNTDKSKFDCIQACNSEFKPANLVDYGLGDDLTYWEDVISKSIIQSFEVYD